MVYGFKIIDDLTDGLSAFLDDKGMSSVADLVGKAVPSVTDWQYLNLNHVEKAVDRSGAVHQVWSLSYRVRGHITPGDHSSREWRTPLRGNRR